MLFRAPWKSIFRDITDKNDAGTELMFNRMTQSEEDQVSNYVLENLPRFNVRDVILWNGVAMGYLIPRYGEMRIRPVTYASYKNRPALQPDDLLTVIDFNRVDSVQKVMPEFYLPGKIWKHKKLNVEDNEIIGYEFYLTTKSAKMYIDEKLTSISLIANQIRQHIPDLVAVDEIQRLVMDAREELTRL